MTDRFDAKAEAATIADLAKATIDNVYGNRILEATVSEDALAKELASVWGDPAKAVPLAVELGKITNEWSTRPNFGLHLENADGQGWNFGNHMNIQASNLAYSCGRIEVNKEGNQLRVSISESHFTPQSITAFAYLPEKQN
jgi:hypothetical protein